MWKPKTVATIQISYILRLYLKLVSQSVAADGSLFLVSGNYVAIDGKSQSNDAANAANNIQNVHIGYLLESDSREAAIFCLPFRPRG